MNPMNKFGGLCLASTATRGLPRFSFIDRHITLLREQGIGHHDKVPVQSHRGQWQTCEKGTLSAMYAVLPWPWERLCSTHQEPGLCASNAQAVQAATVSLCCGTHCKGMDILAQSAFWPVPSLAQLSRLSLTTQRLNSAPAVPFHSSLRLKPRAS